MGNPITKLMDLRAKMA